MLVSLRRANALRQRLPAAAGERAFKTKSKKNQPSGPQAAQQGRDPYAFFKEAIISQPPNSDAVEAAKLPAEAWHEQRAAYSRAKMLEHHRVGKHMTHMIRLRKASLNALPDELRREALLPDYELLPIERRVFTETAPISDFQAKLMSTSQVD